KCTYRLKVGAVTGKLALNLIYSTKPFGHYKLLSGVDAPLDTAPVGRSDGYVNPCRKGTL
ncbi:hypothetical protein, partial [Escherichia coli]|uniref:hypothetical protein n=1 Tax=Escherichia coli TaxID=562 RepID=UPI0027393BC7